MNSDSLKLISVFSGKLLIFLFPAYLIHKVTYPNLGVQIDVHVLQLSYLVNGLLAIFIFSALIFLKNKYKEQLGFLYMFGSFIKFGVFFLVIYPYFKEDGEITKIEFGMFFIPYAISLFMETSELIKILNHKEIK